MEEVGRDEPPPVRVFLSYSHDSELHRERVLQLASRLRNEGVDARIDRYEHTVSDGWIQWMEREILDADFVLVVCTPTYRRRFERREAAGHGHGVIFEAATIQKLIYRNGQRNAKFVPVVFDDDTNAIPLQFADAQTYQIPRDYDDLYRRITSQPEVPLEALGSRRELPPRAPRESATQHSLSSQPSIRTFRDEYLVADPGAPPVPFGGRDLDMSRLDAWLDDGAAPSRFLITAPAGRGKSALLVRWLERLQRQGRLTDEPHAVTAERWGMVFVPISIRFGTNLAEKYLQAIAERLARIAAKTLQHPSIDPVGFYTDQVQELLQVLDDEGTRVLVVLDGLDEALRGEFNPDLFPRRLSGNVRILVSARLQLGDVNWTGWRDRLQWRGGQRCACLELGPLDAAGIRDVLVKMGAPVDELAGTPWLVGRLLELTEGDPLILRYYAEDLWELANESSARITRQDLDTLSPGFGSYFDRWLHHQERAWKAAGDQVDQEAVDAVLAALSFAHGPLAMADIVSVLEHLPEAHQTLHARRALKPLSRFVIGNGQPGHGFVLAHPKIGEHLKRERYAYAAANLRRAFVAWGRREVALANADPTRIERAPEYLVQFYRRHLEEADALHVDTLEDFMALVEDGWRREWEHFEGSQRGFAGDVEAAWRHLRRSDPLSNIGAQLRCVLTLSSIRTVGYNVPAELLRCCVRAGVLTARQAEHLGRLMRGAEDRAVTIGRLAGEFEREPVLRSKLFDEALTASQAILEESSRARVLSALAAHLPPELMSRALAMAMAITDHYYRAQVLSALARHLRPELMPQALAAAAAISGEPSRARALSELAPHLPRELMPQALAVGQAIGGESSRARALSGLAAHLPSELLSEALAAARALGDESARAEALSGLAVRLEAGQRARALRGALNAAQAIRNESARIQALSMLAPHLPPAVLSETLATMQALGDPSARVRALTAFAPHLSPELLSQALTAAQAIGDQYYRARALGVLGPHLQPEIRARVLGEAITAAQSINVLSFRERALRALAPGLPSELLFQALSAAGTIGDNDYRGRVLGALAPHLPPELLSQALAVAQAIGDQSSRDRALSALAPHLPTELLSAALTAAQAIGDQQSRDQVVAQLMPHLVPSDALTTAQAIGDEWYRARALGALARRLPPGLLSQALKTAQGIVDETARAEALGDLAPHLPPELVPQMLSAAQAIGNGLSRNGVLSALAAHLTPELRAKVLDEVLARVQVPALSVLAPHLGPELLSQALAAALAIEGEYYPVPALFALAPHQGPELLPRAVTAGRPIRHQSSRAMALGTLAPHLGPELLSQALTRVQVMEDEPARATALVALAPHLGPELLSQALTRVQVMEDEPARSMALGALAPHLGPDLLSQALTAAGAIEDESSRATALGALVPHLGPELLSAALAAALGMEDESPRAMALKELAPRLPPELLRQALTAAQAIRDEPSRARELSTLARYLPRELLSDALSAAQAIEAAPSRAEVLQALVPRLPPELSAEARRMADGVGDQRFRTMARLAFVQRQPWMRAQTSSPEELAQLLTSVGSIVDNSYRAFSLRALAPQLPPDLSQRALSEALAAALAIEDASSRATELRALAPDLAPELRHRALSQALSATQAITNESRRVEALTASARDLPSELIPVALAQVLDISTRATRPVLLSVLTVYVSAVRTHSGDGAILALRRAILDTAAWYP